MIRIAHVLCPVDFSEISQHALAHAAAVARWYKARLTVLHVFANLPAVDLPPMTLEAAHRDRLMSDLRSMAAAVAEGIPVEFSIREAAYVHEEIQEQAEATRADLLVVGTHGRSGFQRLFLGSVTEKVIRKATCPTLVVPPASPDVPAGSPIKFRQILCPVDFSESSLAALAYAAAVARETNVRLTALHVVEFRQFPTDEPTIPPLDLRPLHESAVADARRKLGELIPEEARASTTVEATLVEGPAYREILRRATERQPSLIVMGAQGRGAFERLLFGSTAHHVVRASACPVLIVRSS